MNSNDISVLHDARHNSVERDSSSSHNTSANALEVDNSFGKDSAKKRRKITLDDFKIEKKLGGNQFNKVLLVRDSAQNSGLYAMKVLSHSELPASAPQNTYCFFEEFERRSQGIYNPFIARLKHTIRKDQKTILIMEYLSGGNIFQHLRQYKLFSEDVARFYLGELILALEYAHQYNMPMSDLTLEGLTLDEKKHLKLSNYGFSCYQTGGKFCKDDEKENYLVDEINFAKMASQILHNRGRSLESTHCWLLGYFLYNMIMGCSPYPLAEVSLKNIEAILEETHLVFTKDISAEAKDLIRRLLRMNADEKLTSFRDIKHHRFFKTLNWADLKELKVKPPSNSAFHKFSSFSNSNRRKSSESREPKSDNEVEKKIVPSRNNGIILGVEKKSQIQSNAVDRDSKENLKQLFGM